MDDLIDNLAAYAGIPTEKLNDEEMRVMLRSFASAVASHCAGRVVKLAKEQLAEGYGDHLRFANEANAALISVFTH
jgi:hypothetical protein